MSQLCCHSGELGVYQPHSGSSRASTVLYIGAPRSWVPPPIPTEAFAPPWAVRKGSGAESRSGMPCWAVSQARGWGSCWNHQGPSPTGRVTLTSLTYVRGTSQPQPHRAHRALPGWAVAKEPDSSTSLLLLSCSEVWTGGSFSHSHSSTPFLCYSLHALKFPVHPVPGWQRSWGWYRHGCTCLQ